MSRSLVRRATVAVVVATWTVLPVMAPPAAAASAVPLSTCHSGDGSMPTWGTPTFTPSTVDVTDAPAEVTITIPVTDKGDPGRASGVRAVRVNLLDRDVYLEPGAGSDWTGTIVVPRNTPPGDHTFRVLEAIDWAGNERSSDSDDLVYYPELETPLKVVAAPLPDPLPVPRPTALTLSTHDLDVRKKAGEVRFVLSVDESEAPAVEAKLTFTSRSLFEEVELERTPGGFEGAVTVPRSWDGTYRARVARIVLVDEYGNRHMTDPRRELGVEPVRVVSRKDVSNPKRLATRVSPRRIDVRTSSRKVTITVRARDKHSGVESVHAYLGAHLTPALKRVKGTPKRGTWRTTVKVGPCDRLYPNGSVPVVIQDRAYNEIYEFGPRLRAKANDLRPPKGSLVEHDGPRSQWPATEPIRLRFNERVTGVNDASFRVVRLDGLFWSEPLAGGLECLGPKGAPVACASTKVKEVVWTSATGALEPGRSYGVQLNPDGNLDIRDLAGNPHRRREEGFGTRQKP